MRTTFKGNSPSECDPTRISRLRLQLASGAAHPPAAAPTRTASHPDRSIRRARAWPAGPRAHQSTARVRRPMARANAAPYHTRLECHLILSSGVRPCAMYQVRLHGALGDELVDPSRALSAAI